MTLLRRRSVFAAKAEATAGTAETLSAADGKYNATNVLIQPNIAMEDREGQGGFNYLPGVPGQRGGTATFSTEISYDGETIPDWAAVLLPACGFVDSSDVFKPKSRGPGDAGVKTLTIGAYVDGTLRTLAGCMGTFVMVFPTGRQARIDWTFQGKWVDPVDSAMITPVYPTTMPMRMAAGAIQWNSASLCTESVSIDAGGNVVLRECAGDATGIASAIVTDRKPMITANPEAVLIATQDRNLQWLTPEVQELTIKTGADEENHLLITVPKAQLQNQQQGDRNNVVIDDLSWLATKGTSPDEEIQIAFVAAASEE